MTFVSYPEAKDIVNRFIDLLARNDITPPTGSSIEAELLSIVELLQQSANLPPSILLPMGGGALDLAAKILAISTQPEFSTFRPHLQLFGSDSPLATAVQTMSGKPTDDVHRKLNELYLGSLAVHVGHNVELDDPSAAVGDNPDVLFDLMPDETTRMRWALAVKTISTKSGQTIFERIREASRQINATRCHADRGMVVINTQGSLDHDKLWNGDYSDLEEAKDALRQQIVALISKANEQRPASDWIEALSGRTSPVVLYVGHAVVRVVPADSSPVSTIVKMMVTDQPSGQPDQIGIMLAEHLNHFMQSINRGVPGAFGVAPA